ncbi:hypothetical protein P9112_007219 [Eukaryota sp. TZLM1-RC]
MLCFPVTFFLVLLFCRACVADLTYGVSIFQWDPLGIFSGVLLFILLVLVFSLTVRLLFHRYYITFLPEPSVLILLGIVIGLFLWGIPAFPVDFLAFPAEIFFIVLILPIILEEGYFMTRAKFFSNFGTIFLLSFVGTIVNALAIGLSLFALSSMGAMFTSIRLAQAMAFGAAMSAVDPIAVIAIFEEIHVNDTLNSLVFGESVINDVVAITLFRLLIGITAPLSTALVFEAIVAFIVVVIGGVLAGVIVSLIATWATKFTYVISVLEALFIVVMAYLAFVFAEIFHFSGDMAIFVFGIIAGLYAEQNISFYSSITVKYFLKLLASVTETIIFVFLGLTLFLDLPVLFFDFALIGWTLLLIQVTRTITIISIVKIVNPYRILKISKRDTFILIYSGLRGAIAFALTFSTPDIPERPAFVATALSVVIFTIFVQGSTIKPILRILQIRLATKMDKSAIGGLVFDRGLSYVREAFESIVGKHEGFLFTIMNWLHVRIEKYLLRAPLAKDDALYSAVDDMLYKEAIDQVAKQYEVTPLTPKRKDSLWSQAQAERKQAKLEGRSPLASPRVQSKEAASPTPAPPTPPPSAPLPPQHPIPKRTRGPSAVPIKRVSKPSEKGEVSIPVPDSPVTFARFDRLTDPNRKLPLHDVKRKR